MRNTIVVASDYLGSALVAWFAIGTIIGQIFPRWSRETLAWAKKRA